MTGGEPLAPALSVDLHMHSTASDGLRSPADVVSAAIRVGMAAIALTDHDTVAGLAAARAAAAGRGLRVVAGVELSCMDEGDELHLLGLGLQREEMLEAQLEEFRSARRTRAERIVQRLNELGLPVTFEAVLREAGAGAIGRPHIARALIAGGCVRDFREAFDRWLGAGRPAFVEKRRLTLAEAIALVHDAGGIAIYAHPGADATRRRLETLVAQGLDGVEVKHPGHTAEDVARIGALAAHLGLLPSGGSDWHGGHDPARMIGSMNVPAAWLEMHDARVRERAEREVIA